jgi:hypothetical protein
MFEVSSRHQQESKGRLVKVVLVLLILKVLSSEMDLAESRIIARSSLKSESRRFPEKSVRPPSCECPLKIPRHLIQLLAIRIIIANGTHSSVSDNVDNGAMNKIGICSKWRWHLKRRMLLFSVSNGAFMNTPCCWKLRDDAYSDVEISANTPRLARIFKRLSLNGNGRIVLISLRHSL